jgi:uncharacterized protein (TIGR01777 family)
MRVVIAGGSGLLGTALSARLQRDGHTITVLTRRARAANHVAWNPDTPIEPWTRLVGEADIVVNLAGESIASRRWTAARKEAIRESRLRATRALANTIQASPRRPLVFLSASGVGVYGPRGEEPVTEETPPGSDFLAGLAVAWEREALPAAAATRVVLLRTGVVLAREGGALQQMAMPFRFYAGGPIGSGRQGIPWIHIDDWVGMARWAIETPRVAGPLNVTAPAPVSNAEFARTLGRVLGRPAVLPAPAFAVRLALGELSTVVLTGQRVLPVKAQSLGFTFRFPDLEGALREIYR